MVPLIKPQKQMIASSKKRGYHYEEVARQYLIAQGLHYIEHNFTTKCGEIDLIMQDGHCIVFAEVKYRKQKNYGHAAETVTKQKQQKLIKTATLWLMKHHLSLQKTAFRFDVLAIHDNGNDISWIKNAITQ